MWVFLLNPLYTFLGRTISPIVKVFPGDISLPMIFERFFKEFFLFGVNIELGVRYFYYP